MEFISLPVISIALFILIIHSIETLAYAVRLSGARVKLIASGLSLFNMMVIVSRMSNMMQQPFTGGLTDAAPEGRKLEVVEEQFRVLIGASTLGTLLGIVLLPTFVALFSRGIIHLSEQGGSVPRLIKLGFKNDLYKRGMNHFAKPGRRYLTGINFRAIPKRLFFINMLITAVYTIGVLSALYAALIVPDRAGSATMASGLINGIATILLTLFIDPKISVLADDVANGKGNYHELKGLSIMMVISRLFGTLLAQLIFIPGSYYIAWMTQFFVMK
ncbi:lipid II flippase Amj family protein [Rossellomorea vietnamensis]|uniref:lipid II flippase Amj family protein n=1 Tax=Rossellomorea TaxID=2837508 RepID=UPI001CC9DEE7|nr:MULTISPECIES: lipid II flippase Amj family protein [Rossellomorea]MCA0147310.1 lipid II flippase Amj family protein [Rossellomorea vietnamensis]UTE76610.1 lipid II flippase Amj family protein [Rossellomorea sp. KS-H15a]